MLLHEKNAQQFEEKDVRTYVTIYVDIFSLIRILVIFSKIITTATDYISF